MIELVTPLWLAIFFSSADPIPAPAPLTPAPAVQPTAPAKRRIFFALSLGRGYGDVVGSFEAPNSGGRDNTFL